MSDASSIVEHVDWEAESLRLTAFPSPTGAFRENQNYWEEIVGEPPENRISQPKVGVTQEMGRFFGGVLVCISRPDRVDWLLNGPSQGELIGPFKDVTGKFYPMVSRWLDGRLTLQRLAVGMILRAPVQDRIAGYRILSSYLPHVKLDPEGSTDFLFQINRPRKSALNIDGLTINRLSRWSVGFIELATFTVQPKHFELTDVESNLHCRLELDINTAPLTGDLPSGQLNEISKELISQAEEIATEGDIS